MRLLHFVVEIHAQKGMQTVQDFMIKNYMICVIGNFIVSNLPLIKFHYLALAFVHSTYFMVIATMSQIFNTIMVRYLSLFHQKFWQTWETFLLLTSFLTRNTWDLPLQQKILDMTIGLSISFSWIIQDKVDQEIVAPYQEENAFVDFYYHRYK